MPATSLPCSLSPRATPHANTRLRTKYSLLKYTLRNILFRVLIKIICLFSPSLRVLIRRIKESPGLPVDNPSMSYWMIPPSPLSKWGSGRSRSTTTGGAAAATICSASVDININGSPYRAVKSRTKGEASGSTDGGTARQKEKSEDMLKPSLSSTDSNSPSGRDELAQYADIVVIGSGITGTCFARTILDWDAHEQKAEGSFSGEEHKSLQLVMLEARELCSGATGRNGGHISPVLYQDYDSLVKRHGLSMANKIIRFRLSHLNEMLGIAEVEGLLHDSQCRSVRAYDVYRHLDLFSKSKQKLKRYCQNLPAESASYRVHSTEDELKSLQLSKEAVGAFSTVGGAIHPYRFVTGILSRLLKVYSSNFRIYTQTPCISIESPRKGDPTQLYRVLTPRGIIHARHVIHATNAWSSHLLPRMRGRIIPTRGFMAAMLPRSGLGYMSPNSTSPNPSLLPSSHSSSSLSPADVDTDSFVKSKPASWSGSRSFVFYSEAQSYAYDYLTQQLPSTIRNSLASPSSSASQSHYPPSNAELMLGVHNKGNCMVTELASTDDRTWNPTLAAYIKGALSGHFTVYGDQEVRASRTARDINGVPGNKPDEACAVSGASPEEHHRNKDEVKMVWSGILGLSADEMPWVGPISESITQRPRPASSSVFNRTATSTVARPTTRRTAPPAEWIAAGYTGEGMVHAWMCAKALAYMVLDVHHKGNQASEQHASNHDFDKWLPEVYQITEDRWERATMEGYIVSNFF